MVRPRKYPLPKPDGLWSTRDVCEFLGISRQTLLRYRRTFDDFPVPDEKHGDHWYREEDVIRWRDERLR